MKKSFKQALSLLLVAAMLVACIPAVMAAEDQTSGTVPVAITASTPTFSVTVPTTLPIHMDAYGDVTCGDITITNNSAGPVQVEDTQLTALNGWALVDYDTTTFLDTDKGQHRVALKLDRDNGVTAAGADIGEDFIPAGGGQQTVSVSVKLPYQGVEMTDATIAQVVFVLGWYKVNAVIEGPDTLQWSDLLRPTATLTLSDGSAASEWTWRSSNPNALTVFGGYVTAKDIGSFTISASKDGVTISKDIEVTWDKEAVLGQIQGHYETLGFLSGGENTTMGGQQVAVVGTWDGRGLSCEVYGYKGVGNKVSFSELRVPTSAIESISTSIADFVLTSDGEWVSEYAAGASDWFGAMYVTFN